MTADISPTWTKVELGIEWGHVFYARAGNLRRPSGVNNIEEAIKFTDGETIRVRFPDGMITECLLTPRMSYVMVNDTERRTRVEQVRFGIEYDVHGIACWIPIEELEVETSRCAR